MIEKQYSIGEFAAVNKITPRMLRHYDKIGLLNPAVVLENGYRAYTSAQIQIVSSIRLYQSCGFTLAEVRRLLDADETDVQRAAKTKLAELNLQDKTQQLARGLLLALPKSTPASYTNHYDIFYTQQSARMLLCCAVLVAEAEIEDAIERLYHAIAVQNNSPDDHLLLLSDLETADAYRVAVPMRAPLACDSYECVLLESGWYLGTMHHGDYYSIGMAYDSIGMAYDSIGMAYDSIGMAYDRLLRYAEEKGHMECQQLVGQIY